MNRQSYSSSSSRHNSLMITKLFHRLLFHSNPLLVNLAYFLTLSIIGCVTLRLSKPRVKSSMLDLFYTSVSASTVSSMTAVEMEAFSNFQLVAITVLMLLGGEVFTSLLGIQFQKLKFRKTLTITETETDQNNPPREVQGLEIDARCLELDSVRCLGYVVLGYLLVIHVVGSVLIFSYVSTVSSARHVLKAKGIELQTFSVFSTVSSFSNCGYIPTNENMIVFKRNSGLLLLLITQILLGNTLYPVFLRLVIFALGKLTKRREFVYLMKSYAEVDYDHLFSGLRSCLLALTATAFVLVQVALFCAMEWNSKAMDGMSLYQKLVASLFQVVNSRHSGESVFDISLIAPAILALFVVMMYLPPYTSFLPIMEDKASSINGASRRITIVDRVALSNLSYLAIFVVLICISERESMKNDPLNFNVLNVVIEVVSAYGNVGFSAGYSCQRRLSQEGDCTDKWFGFSGKWSSTGKLLLITVMLFGRLKKFNMKGGKAWEF